MTTETATRYDLRLEKVIEELRAEVSQAREKGTKRIHIELFIRSGMIIEGYVDPRRVIDLPS